MAAKEKKKLDCGGDLALLIESCPDK